MRKTVVFLGKHNKLSNIDENNLKYSCKVSKQKVTKCLICAIFTVCTKKQLIFLTEMDIIFILYYILAHDPLVRG